MDSEILSRLQFAFTLSYHIIFPTLTIGLACYIATMEGLWLKTANQKYAQQVNFWLKPFAVTFGMGVVTGVVLSYEFGANFSGFSEVAGPVIGPLMAYEVMTAFFLEAGFLGIMLFGRKRVHPKIYFGATATVAVGTLMSSFWIIAANSWMQTPAGTEFVNGHFEVISWWQVIFNPSFPYRLTHMLLASFVTTGFVVSGVSAAILLKSQTSTLARLGLKQAIVALVILTPLQIFVGDLHGLNVKEHQPIKVAAMEGIWDTEKGAGFRILAWPNKKEGKNDWEITIPKLASLILTHDLNGEIQGLNSVPKDQIPNVGLVFYSFRVMLGLGVLMILCAFWSGWLLIKGKLWQSTFSLKWLKLMIPSGFIATLAGWYVAEVGRQPWVIYNLVRTHDVYSPLAAEKVALSLTLFVVCYSVLFWAYLYFMKKIIRHGAGLAVSEQQLGSAQPIQQEVNHHV
ncbi:MAG: cytochrome ubiquinol oxidase subunit I [Algicola sp.]|nr:cytochrome ubiquinol oxidase subunit I [Algicola sp.]